RIQSDEMLQLTEAGIPAWQMLANKIGKSVPEVMDMVSKGAVDAVKSCFQQLGSTFQSVLTILKPCFTVILTLLYAIVQVWAWIFGYITEVLMKLATGFVNLVNLLLQVVEWAANGINTFLNSIANDFMNLADSVLPEFASSALKRISGFVTTAIGWLNNLISKIFETDDALSEAKGEEKKAPKAPKKLEIPKYDQFKNTAPTGATNVPKIAGATGASAKTDNSLLNEAANTSKQIADEWYRTFSTKSAMVDRWYKEESDSLEKSRALNSNYEVDKQRLTELYAQKRLDALREEAKERDDLINKARELGINSKTADIALYSSEGTKQLEQMRLDYTKTLNSISDRWAEQQRNFTGMTEAQKNTYLAALKEYGVAYELNAQQEISFTQEAEKEKLAAFKKYQDERLEYYTQCKDIQADIDKAYATASYSALKSALSKENLARISAYNEAKTTMQAYYDATTEAHMSFKERMTNAITESQNSFQNFFSDVLTMQTSFVDGMGELLNNLFDNIVNQITAGWAASITQGALSFLMPGNGNNGGSGDGAGGDQLANFGTALDAATGSVNGLGAGVGAANGAIGTGTSLMGAYNGIQSLITGTTKPAEGAATTAVTAALTALATAATSASIALSAMSASSGFGFGLFAKGGVVKAAGGGSIVGAGTGTSDSIPAMLSNGEYVLTAATVNRLGLPFLDKLNAGDFPGYAEGGLVRPNLYAGAGVSTAKSSDSQSLAEKTINIIMNISTMDAQSFQEFLERNGGREAIQQVAYDAERNFLTNKGAW
ncbi:tape measure protein, partial [Phascolarctobacterium succinatutens]|uniref:tape measure protein n=1 Tax=Phascolarctobacterium succinatutens TaxID=626940 RepID=UPI003AF717BC